MTIESWDCSLGERQLSDGSKAAGGWRHAWCKVAGDSEKEVNEIAQHFLHWAHSGFEHYIRRGAEVERVKDFLSEKTVYRAFVRLTIGPNPGPGTPMPEQPTMVGFGRFR